MPLNREGTLTADEVYALTAYLLYINDVIPEDETLDAQSLPKVKMPIGDKYASLPDWKPGRQGSKVTPTKREEHEAQDLRTLQASTRRISSLMVPHSRQKYSLSPS
jgi:hypothetical protein